MTPSDAGAQCPSYSLSWARRVLRSGTALILRLRIWRSGNNSPCSATRSKRPRFGPLDRAFWVWLSRRWAGWREALHVVRPETVIRWHRQGFRAFWTWKSRSARTGRPSIGSAIAHLVRTMALANPLWGAPRIHGELLKLGFDVSQRTVARLMPRRSKPSSQTWRTFLENHIADLVSIDFFLVPTATFRVLYVFVVLLHRRRRVVHFNVTDSPTAAWTAQQIIEAFPRYLLRRLRSYLRYYHGSRTHLALEKDAPEPRAIELPERGRVVALPRVGGLHHRYVRREA